MFELNASDYSLLSWVQQADVPVHSFSVRFHPGSLIVRCQTLEVAGKLWEKRTLLNMPGKELCFQVNDTFYVGTTMK